MIRALAFGALLLLGACSESAVDQIGAAEDVDQTALGNPIADASAGVSVAGCRDGEQPMFACTMKSGKLASVCVTGEGADQFAQYRFGPADAPAELIWPEQPSSGKLAFKTVPYSGGGEAQISFTRGDTTYVVFSRIVRTNFTPGEPNNPSIEDGIMILRDGASLGELHCDGDADPAVDVTLAETLTVPADELYAP